MIGHLYLGRYALGEHPPRHPCAPQPWTPHRLRTAETTRWSPLEMLRRLAPETARRDAPCDK